MTLYYVVCIMSEVDFSFNSVFLKILIARDLVLLQIYWKWPEVGSKKDKGFQRF